MLVIGQTLHLDVIQQSAPYTHPTETTLIVLPPTIKAMEMTQVMMITAMELTFRESLMTIHMMRKVLTTNPMILTTPMMMYNTI